MAVKSIAGLEGRERHGRELPDVEIVGRGILKKEEARYQRRGDRGVDEERREERRRVAEVGRRRVGVVREVVECLHMELFVELLGLLGGRGPAVV